jgi:hypothetical protein
VNRRFAILPAAAALAAVTVSCAPRLASLPAGGGAAFPDFAAAYDRATTRCRDIRTLRGVVAVSGRAAGRRFPRASLDVGFEAPSNIRLELPAPGQPLFIYVASGDRATLLLPRDRRVLRDAPPAATLDALAGIPLAPDQLRSIVAGCGFGAGQAGAGRAFERGWASVDVGDAVTYLQQIDGRWQVIAATRGAIEVRYADYAGGVPSTVRIRTPGAAAATDLTMRLTQVDTNETLSPDVFRIDVPSDASPMTLDELRQAGPLGR